MSYRDRAMVYCDFEYRDDGRELILGCFLHDATGERVAIDFRSASNPQAAADLHALVRRWGGAVWASYSAGAEIAAMLTAGLDVSGMDWLCLMAEARQITASHRKYLLERRANLLATLRVFDIETRGDREHKEQMRDLILSTPDYTPEQWAVIVDYCWSDIEPLPALWVAIQQVFAASGVADYLEGDAPLLRGDYLKAVAQLQHRSRGFPVDAPLLERLYRHRPLVMRAVAEEANKIYGRVYRLKKDGSYSFHFEGLEESILSQPVLPDWERTASGRRRLDENYLDEFVAKNPFYLPLKKTRTLLRHFASTDLRSKLRDGFIQGASVPLYTTTGRNQPMARSGFILNLAPWLRSLVRPEEGHVLIAADWSQQEIVIAAALSGDLKLVDALDSGDVYTAVAKLANAIPPDGNKASHPQQRATYKAAVLGVGFGMQGPSLGQRIYVDLRNQAITAGLPLPDPDDCRRKAEEILEWHRDTFQDFWAWNSKAVREARRCGYMQTVDRWTTFCDGRSKSTALGNFPIQATAAAILRQAIRYLADHSEIEFVASLHDAIYIYSRLEDEERHTAILKQAMTAAVADILAAARLPLKIKIESQSYGHATGYVDGRDTMTLPAILKMLEARGV